MRVGLRIFRPQTIAWLREALQRGQLSRAALGRGICEREDWRNPKGEYCTASARKVLPTLAAQLELPLPDAGGPLGVLSFVAAPFRLGPRDAFLGWDDRTRGAHIERIVSNDRFVLVQGVQVKNLASHVLGKTLQRLARDWEQAHGVRPLAGGDLRAKFATGHELQGGRPAVRGLHAGAAAGSGREGGDEGGLAAGIGAGLAAQAVPEAGADAGAVPGVGVGRGGELGPAGVPALGPAGRAAAGPAGADGAELGAASGGGFAGDLPAPDGAAGGDAPLAQQQGERDGHSATAPGGVAGAGAGGVGGVAGAGHDDAELHESAGGDARVGAVAGPRAVRGVCSCTRRRDSPKAGVRWG